MERKIKREKIAAVVVTYNRKELLKECLDAILHQTYPVDSIILIDNASTDGTPNFLKEKGYFDNPKIDYMRLPENTGGAGGFYEGIKRAYKKYYDWIWCMDDDGKAEKNTLEELINSKVFNNNNCLNSLVLCPKSKKLSFFIPLLSSYNSFLDYYFKLTDDPSLLKKESKSSVYEWAMFFNSTLISRKIIEKVGLPKKELFIWGDEVEYFLRIRKYGFRTFIILDSIFYHPKKMKTTEYSLKDYFKFRNYVYINKNYKKWFFARLLILLLRAIRTRQPIMLKAIYCGLVNKFN